MLPHWLNSFFWVLFALVQRQNDETLSTIELKAFHRKFCGVEAGIHTLDKLQHRNNDMILYKFLLV